MSLQNNQFIVRSLAKEFRGRTETTNCFNPNVCNSDFLPTKPAETKFIPGDCFELEARFLWENHRFLASANNEFVDLSLRLVGVGCTPVFSVNRRDAVMRFMERVKQPVAFPSLVYAADSTSAAAVGSWLSVAANAECIRSFILKEKDSLHVYGNQLSLFLFTPSRSRVAEMLPLLVQLTSHLVLVSDGRIDFGSLPKHFLPLKPLMKKWAVTDDVERDFLISRASKTSLKKLVDGVCPLIPAINAYLDSFGEKAMPEAACALGALAECATEVKPRLGRFDGSSTTRR